MSIDIGIQIAGKINREVAGGDLPRERNIALGLHRAVIVDACLRPAGHQRRGREAAEEAGDATLTRQRWLRVQRGRPNGDRGGGASVSAVDEAACRHAAIFGPRGGGDRSVPGPRGT